MPRSRSSVDDRRLRRLLRYAPEAITADLKREIREAGSETLVEMQSRVQVKTGDLRANLLSIVQRDGLSVRIGASRGPGFKRAWKRGAWKAHIVEKGTRPHKIPQPKLRRVMSHPGARPFPFFEPARRKAFAKFQPRILRAVKRALERLSRGVGA